jgi:hypothetical protein
MVRGTYCSEALTEMRIEYYLIEIAGTFLFLGTGGFLVLDSLAQPGQPMEVLGGSVLLALGGLLTVMLARALFHRFQNNPSHE